MSRKWEQAIPTIEAYLLLHNDKPYLSDMVEELHLSAYVIETALSKLGSADKIQHGLSPEKKLVRDKKISENILKQHADGVFPKISYDDEWKAKCKEGRAGFDADPEAQKKALEQRNRTNVAKYGEDYATQFQEKAKQTKLERYGSASYNNYKKACETRLEKYGDANYNNREQAFQTCNERYGGVGNASPELLAKYEATCMEKYGVRNSFLSSDPSVNGTNGIIDRFGSKEAMYAYTLQKGQHTRLKEHGDPFWSNHEKAKETNLALYGVENYFECREARQARQMSKPTQLFYEEFLVPKYGYDDIELEYKDSERYPYFCDFYVKSIDLFVEFNYFWTHGKHPFDPNCQADQDIVEIWKNKHHPFYDEAIRIWTIVDVQKQACAKRNKLNYQAVYVGEGGKYVIF